MQQFCNLGDVGYIGGGAMGMENQIRLNNGTDMSLHPEKAFVTFLGLMHLGISLCFFVLGRTGSMNNRRIDDDALAREKPFTCNNC